MNFTNNNFRGYIDGKNLYHYTSNLDYTIQNTDKRIKYIEDRLGCKLLGYKILERCNSTYDMKVQSNDTYWEDIFTQTSDVALDKDGLYQIEEGKDTRLVSYSEYMVWCELNGHDAIEYSDTINPFEAIEYEDINEDDEIYDDAKIERGEWRYTGQNTSKIKLVLNKSDDLYSTSNIAIGLEKLASYILNAPVHIVDGKKVPKKEAVKYKIYNSRELYKRACQEHNLINDFMRCNGITDRSDDLDGEAMILFQPHKQNFNKVKTVKFMGKGDIKKYPILNDYMKLHDKLKEEMSSNDNKIDKKKIPYIMKGIKDDLNMMKMLCLKPIIFKAPLSFVPTSPYKNITIPYKDELYAMLQLRIEDLRDLDMFCCHIDLMNIMKKCRFTDRQKEILELWGRDFSTTEIAEALKITHPEVVNYFKRILNSIVKKYNEQYEDWIGFNYKKSEWKQCSKCGEVKLIQRFNKNGKYIMSMCKNCDLDRKK